jgi:hypothetical protein
MRHATHIFIALLFTAGCDDSGADIDTTARGKATYDDARTDAGGNPAQPASPPSQSSSDPMRLTLMVSGTGEITGLEPACALDGATGSFEGLFAGEASLDGDGAYLAALASGDAFFSTPSGCDIPDVQISALTEVVVRGELSATTQNCETYCQARARAYGEGECGAEAGSATCRAEAEGEYSAACTTQCTASTTHSIVAETRLSTQAVADLSARSLTGAALGEIEVDLSFDRMETAAGEPVDENP